MIVTRMVHFVAVGTRVWVHNHKSKPKDGSKRWEEGVIMRVEFGAWSLRGEHAELGGPSYEVRLDRKNPKGYPMRLHASSERISLTKPA